MFALNLLTEVAIVGWKRSLLVLGLVGRGWCNVLDVGAGSSKWFSKSVALFILLTRLSWGGVQAPLGLKWLVNLLGLGKLEVADFLWDGGAFSNRVELGDKFGLEAAGLLGVKITSLLGNINEGGDDLIMALLFSFLSDATSTADLNRELLTLGVSNKLARLLLNVLGGAR